MQSKTSYFNKTIFFKNIKRFWPIWGSYLLLLFLILPFSIGMNSLQNPYFNTENFALQFSDLLNSTASPLLLSIFCVLSASCVFSYLMVGKNANMIHSLPVRREELYLTNYVSGLLFIVLPQLVIYFSTILVCKITGLDYIGIFSKWLLITLTMILFFYSMAVMLCMFSGNIYWPPILFFIFNLLYVGCKFILISLAKLFLFGFTNPLNALSQDTLLSPLYYLMKQLTFRTNAQNVLAVYGDNSLWIYGIAALFFFVFGLILYKCRHLECSGDVISLNWMKPFFLWCASFTSVLLCLLLFFTIFFNQYNSFSTKSFSISLIALIILGIACFFFVEMIIKKKFRVFTKKKRRECGLFVGLLLLLFITLRLDFFHIVAKVPDNNQISSASLELFYTMEETSPKEIQFVTDLHKKIIDNKKAITSQSVEHGVMPVTITYHLKNGSSLTRAYQLPTVDETNPSNKEVAAIVTTLTERSNTPSYFKKALGFSTTQPASFVEINSSIELSTKQPNGSDSITSSHSFTPEQSKQLLDSYIADLEEGNCLLYYTTNQTNELDQHFYFNQISINFISSQQTDSGSHSLSFNSCYYNNYNMNIYRNANNVSLNFRITDSCTHTLAFLKQMGISQDALIPLSQY
ncbi:MAG: hypothetical protein RSE55_06675 [Lachnospiraceae bacterium]